MQQNIDNPEEIRINNLNKLKNYKINPYPSKAKRTNVIDEVKEKFDEFIDNSIFLCGRLRLMRRHGKATFANLEDESGNIQIFFSQDEVGKEKYQILRSIEVGDFIQIKGNLFKTKKGEKTVLVKNFKILSKALKPLPEKWHGLKDEEEKLRKRYLDLLFNPDLKEIFRKKALFWQNTRNFLIARGFLEVETPVLEIMPGGADAKPFKTHHNALGIDLYLRISMGELWQKKLMIAGYEKTFEIGRQFRNEGIDSEHLQDYSQMEFYMAYADYNDGMKITEEMYKEIIYKTFSTLKFNIRGYKIDFSQKWKKIDYVSQLQKEYGIDVLKSSEPDIKQKCKELNIIIDGKIGKGRLIDLLWKRVRKKIAGPAFLINHPVEVSPLSKRKHDDNRLVERFQIIIAGSELGNGYSELNDPIDQEYRFMQQAKLRRSGDEEAQMHDKDFVEALRYGMPPTCGFGFSERLFSFLVDRPIRETVIFPLMRSKYNKIDVSVEKQDIKSFKVKRDELEKILKTFISDKKNILHAYETEVAMRGIAKRLGKNEELWGAIGLLYNINKEIEQNSLDIYSKKIDKALKKISLPEIGINAINPSQKLNSNQKNTDLNIALDCSAEIVSLIFSAVLASLSKKIDHLEKNTIKKKYKDKSFAVNVDRNKIIKCEKIGLSLDELIDISLTAMREIKDKLGL